MVQEGMKAIIVENNLFALAKMDLDEKQVFFSPRYNSVIQEKFWRSRYDELLKLIPNLIWGEAPQESVVESVLALDALYEKKKYGTKLAQQQNRLFDFCSFNLKSFTPFRIQAEGALPAYYADAVAPWDQNVIDEIHYYFHLKRLPLTYLETRNELVGRDGSTKFSSYLSSGVLDVRYLYNQVREFKREHGASKSTYWIIFELLWREYFYWHYHSNARNYFSRNGLKGKFDFFRPHLYSFNELSALTDEKFFQAALNELKATGYLSNRARQIFASTWINDLELDWVAGAKFFEDHLIDFDVFSNYGNWMYLAGVGVDPRGKRYFNVKKQLETYDPQGLYFKTWL